MVGSAAPFTSTTLVEMNPEPLTVNVTALEPAVILVGLIDVTNGVGVVPPPPDPPEPPEPFDPEPLAPQPLITTERLIPKTEMKKSNVDLRNEPGFTDRPAFSSMRTLQIDSRFPTYIRGVSGRHNTLVTILVGHQASGLAVRDN